MDGNGRWADRRGHRRVFGHIRGSKRVKAVVREAERLGVQALTLYTFSTENWNRPEAELQVIWKLLKKYLLSEMAELHKNNVQLHVIGEVERLSPDLREVINTTVNHLSKNTGLHLTFAVSYGARTELVRAAKLFAEDCVNGHAKPEEMNEQFMRRYLWRGEDVDLVIRTSGERRVSNFLLYQAAYAEFFFTDVCWPDFSPAHLREAVADFGSRERRFGGLKNPAPSLAEAGALLV
jgi:undecaprenyl diphosphate synthase